MFPTGGRNKDIAVGSLVGCHIGLMESCLPNRFLGTSVSYQSESVQLSDNEDFCNLYEVTLYDFIFILSEMAPCFSPNTPCAVTLKWASVSLVSYYLLVKNKKKIYITVLGGVKGLIYFWRSWLEEKLVKVQGLCCFSKYIMNTFVGSVVQQIGNSARSGALWLNSKASGKKGSI